MGDPRAISELLELAGDPALARVMRGAEVRRALQQKTDREIAELIEVALEAYELESDTLVAVLETASYRLQRAGGGAAPAIDLPHAFEPFRATTEVCWVCGELADHDVHVQKAGGEPGLNSSTGISAGSPSALWAALSAEQQADALRSVKVLGLAQAHAAQELHASADNQERYGHSSEATRNAAKVHERSAARWAAVAALLGGTR